MFNELDEDLFTKDLIIKTLDVIADNLDLNIGYLELLRYDITKTQYTELIKLFMEADKEGRKLTLDEFARKFAELRNLNKESYEPEITEGLRSQTIGLLRGLRQDGIMVSQIDAMLPEDPEN